MAEEIQSTSASERIATPANTLDAVTTPSTNGQAVSAPMNRNTTPVKVQAFGLRLAISAVLFVVLALLSAGVMLLLDWKLDHALIVAVLGSFLAAVALHSFLPSPPALHADPNTPSAEISHSMSGDLMMLLRWLAGVFLILVCVGLSSVSHFSSL